MVLMLRSYFDTSRIFSSDGAQEVQTSVRSFVRPFGVIVWFMCYKGFKGCCKGQEQSRGAKKGPVGSIRFDKVQKGSRRFKKVQEGSRKFQRFQEVSGGTKKVLEGSEGF